MTGAFDSVIGVNKEKAIENFINQIPRRLDLGKKDIRLNGVVIVADRISGRASSIVRIEEVLGE
jgi:calcineurin-like phosphoesterase